MPLLIVVERKLCWRFTWPARLVILTAAIAFVPTAGRSLCDFLSVTDPVDARFLVVEGWMPAYAFGEAVEQFRRGVYEKIIIVGGDSAAETAGGGCANDKDIVRFGAPKERVVIAGVARTERDRTFHSALAIKAWLTGEGVRSASLDIVTLGPHARRSRLLFEKALGDEMKVGVIAVADRRFEQQHWWRSSAGFRIVTGEAIAYLYAMLFPWTRD